MRQVVLDTETTGIDPRQGHRIIEIGCVELMDRKLTGNHYHVYINPERVVEEEAISVHGLDNAFLADKPRFAEIAEGFKAYIEGAELVIHNAAFDVGFIDHEFKLLNKHAPPVSSYCSVLDTLAMAREKHPGQKNNLDALCKRYGIDNSHRELHGALLDAEILADVYLLLSGGQTALDLTAEGQNASGVSGVRRLASGTPLKIVRASEEELQQHQSYLDGLVKSSGSAMWNEVGTESQN
ncbi:MAG: DNA polymerase III subunit epsilon [Oleiphilus sp.]|nr:MAG: DNA polymerase III subunit epsilon [Oleiphilus sp.]